MRGSRLKSCVCRARIACHDSSSCAHVFVLTLSFTFLSLLAMFSLIILSFLLPINFIFHEVVDKFPVHSLMRTLALLPSTTLSHLALKLGPRKGTVRLDSASDCDWVGCPTTRDEELLLGSSGGVVEWCTRELTLQDTRTHCLVVTRSRILRMHSGSRIGKVCSIHPS